MLQAPGAEGYSDWKVMKWKPFEVKPRLILQPRKKKGVKAKPVLFSPLKRPTEAVVSDPAMITLPDQIWPDIRSRYLSELSARVWSGYLLRAGISPAAPRSAIMPDTIFLSDVSRDILSRDDFAGRAPERINGAAVEDSGKPNVKITFFNRDMLYINKDTHDRDMGRYSAWELLTSQPAGMHNQNMLDTLGKVFEPKVDLGIEF
jgi:hypothetical protein